MQSLYNITIAHSSGTIPSDGFIDNMTIQQYLALGDAAPTTLALSLAKSRGNARYVFLCQQLSLMGNIYITEVVQAGADCNTDPTTFQFVATVEHGDENLYVYDETNSNAILTGIPALVRMCARALCESRVMKLAYYDPTATTAPGNTNVADRMGIRIDQETVGAASANLTAAAALVTVVRLA